MGFPIMGWDAEGNWVTLGNISDPTDMLGNTRFIDGNGDGKVTWDIGAYEFNSFRPPRFNIAPQLIPEGWRLNITGAANQWVCLQRSGDLRNWNPVYVVVPGLYFFIGAEGVAQVTDRDFDQRAMFYRVVVP